MQDKVLYKDDDVTVTSARAIIQGTTYVVANISSVGHEKDVKGRIAGAVLILISVFAIKIMFLLMPILLITGILLTIYGVRYHVTLTAGAGEKHALSDRRQKRVEDVASAINLAITHQARHASGHSASSPQLA